MKRKDLLTVIYYTSNREDEDFENKIKARLLKTIGDLPLISVSQKPIDFGKNICVGDVGVSNQNAFRQFQLGAMHAKTPFVLAAEADCLYPKEYFEYIPEKTDMCCRYDNVWIMYKNSTAGFVRKEYSECAQVWGKEILIKHINKRLKGKGQWNPLLEHGSAVPKMFGRRSWIYFHGKIPVVNVKTTEGMHRFTSVIKAQDPLGVKSLPHWGTAAELRRKLFPKKYHILTPFNREGNLKRILKNFKHPNVIFHPLIDRPIEFPKEDWIEPFIFKRDAGIKNIAFHAWNKFFDSGKLIDEEYYLFLSDDDFLEPGFFKKINNINTDVILVSMKFGDRVTSSGYGTGTLIPRWHLLQRSRIGTEQLIAKGKILKNERFRDIYNADGLFIGQLYDKNPHKNFTFKTDAYIWFNYLEPGRWNK